MDTFDRFISFIKEAQLKSSSLLAGASNVAQRVGSPFVTAVNEILPFDEDAAPISYSLGKAIGGLVQKPFANPNATARKSSKMKDTDILLDYINKTDESEMLLREARKLRRRARVIQQQREAEEALKKHVESSHYF